MADMLAVLNKYPKYDVYRSVHLDDVPKKIMANGSVDLFVIQASNPYILFLADTEKTLEALHHLVCNDTLNIGIDESVLSKVTISSSWFGNSVKVSSTDTIKSLVIVAVPTLEHLVVCGSGSIAVKDIDQSRLIAEVHGSGDLILSGTAYNTELSVKGSGSISASKLRSWNAALEIQGSGEISAYATKMCNALVQGSGDIVVKGNPSDMVTKKIHGSGTIKIM